MLTWNQDVDSGEYEKLRYLPRPGHADYTAFTKYGGFNDFRGGGRFSGRITAGFVMAGTVARKLLDIIGVEILAHTVEIGGIKAEPKDYDETKTGVAANPLRCADAAAAAAMTQVIEQAWAAGDSIGGVIEGIARNVPTGLGEPVFATLDGELAKALLAVPAVKGVEFGSGFAAVRSKGSENNDPFAVREGKVVTLTNNAGGVLGGISNGMPLVVRVAVKPTPSISRSQPTADMQSNKETSISVTGRHDACIVPRAVVVVEAMLAVTLCDHALRAGLIPRVIK
jgi:chorismate synthase